MKVFIIFDIEIAVNGEIFRSLHSVHKTKQGAEQAKKRLLTNNVVIDEYEVVEVVEGVENE